MEKGSIYILIDKGNHLVKIGYTTQLDKRMGTHWRSNPKLEIWGVFPGLTLRHEQMLHKVLKKFRLEGEKEFYVECDQLLELASTTLYQWFIAQTLDNEG